MKTARSKMIRETLERYVKKRLSDVLKKFEGKEDAQSKKDIDKAYSDYSLENILSEGGKYADQVQIATHIAKAIHPDLKVKAVTNVLLMPNSISYRNEVGSHILKSEEWDFDATGNGAVNKKGYELYRLLSVSIEGVRFLDLLVNDDPDALLVLSDDPGIAKEISSKLIEIESNKCLQLSSHSMAKQLYWLVGENPVQDDQFNLLAPLYPASLVHTVYKMMQEDRKFNKASGKAKRDNVPFDGEFQSYPSLAMQKLGGTKPQNISQLNSERGGVNYLLASLPPRWNKNRSRNFLFVDSALDRFRGYEGVNALVKALITLLKSNPEPTMETRVAREKIERLLGESLAAFGLATRQLHEPGWTRDAGCRLPLCEQLWLDSERAALPFHPDHEDADRAFQQAFEWKDWPDEVAHRFGNWLNDILKRENFPVGDAEHAQWAKQALIDAEWPAPMQRRALKTIAEEVTHG